MVDLYDLWLAVKPTLVFVGLMLLIGSGASLVTVIFVLAQAKPWRTSRRTDHSAALTRLHFMDEDDMVTRPPVPTDEDVGIADTQISLHKHRRN